MTLPGALIKQARVKAGLTQTELARRASTSQPAIAAYEAGDKVPNAATLERLVRAAGATLTTEQAPAPPPGGMMDLLRTRREELLTIAAAHHARNVRVFGSVARGEEHARSDVDLLIDLESGASLLDQVRVRRAISDLLGVDVDVVTTGSLLPRDRSSILEDAVPL